MHLVSSNKESMIACEDINMKADWTFEKEQEPTMRLLILKKF